MFDAAKKVPHLFRFRSSHERHIATELFNRTIDGRFLIYRMQHRGAASRDGAKNSATRN
jgi:hypothetical protein